jgi:hypothetical protein
VRRWFPLAALLLGAVAAGGCGARTAGPPGTSSTGAAAIALDLSRTRPLGDGPRFRPAALRNPRVTRGEPFAGLRCGRPAKAYGVHVELFAQAHGIAVPAGIGIAAPQRSRNSVVSGRCAYPLHTVDPTGVVEVERPRRGDAPTLGELFAIWGEPLSGRRIASFEATGRVGVKAFVDGRRWHGNPAAIPLGRHLQIVIELGPFVAPHPAYTFPPGL